MSWTWPGQETIRAFSRKVTGKAAPVKRELLVLPSEHKMNPVLYAPNAEAEPQHYVLELDLAPPGTAERVEQLKALKVGVQRMLEDEADAYRTHLRPGV